MLNKELKQGGSVQDILQITIYFFQTLTLLTAGAEDGTVTLFSSKDNTLIQHVTPGPSEPVNCVTFNPRFDQISTFPD